MRNFNLDEFVHAYMVCALWSSSGPEEGEHACENLADDFNADDISEECKKAMRETCADFCKANLADLQEYSKRMRNEQWSGESAAGHDFWLTRNRHGAGFWDRGLGALGERLSKAAKVYGSVFLYPGEDGLIYGE